MFEITNSCTSEIMVLQFFCRSLRKRVERPDRTFVALRSSSSMQSAASVMHEGGVNQNLLRYEFDFAVLFHRSS